MATLLHRSKVPIGNIRQGLWWYAISQFTLSAKCAKNKNLHLFARFIKSTILSFAYHLSCRGYWHQISCSGYGRREAVEILLNAGANVHARDDGGLIPLHNACSFGHAEVVSLLLRAGADPNARDNWSYTPLHEGRNTSKRCWRAYFIWCCLQQRLIIIWSR